MKHFPVSGYTFLKNLTPQVAKEKNRVGLYKNAAGQKVVIKKHDYRHKDIHYQYLKNEAKTLQMVNKINFGDNIAVPKIIKVVEKNSSLAIIFSFAEGKMIFDLKPEKKMVILKHILKSLPRVETMIPKIKNIFFFFILYFCQIILKNPGNAGFFLKNAQFFFRFYFAKGILNSKPTLAHGGLYQNSILYDEAKDQITIVDWEDARLAPQHYDLALVCRYYFAEFNKAEIKKLLDYFLKSEADRGQFKYLTVYGCFAEWANRKLTTSQQQEIKSYLSFIFSE